jgi:hypothetical protein
VILAKMAQLNVDESDKDANHSNQRTHCAELPFDDQPTLIEYLLHTPDRINTLTFWSRMALLVGLTV